MNSANTSSASAVTALALSGASLAGAAVFVFLPWCQPACSLKLALVSLAACAAWLWRSRLPEWREWDGARARLAALYCLLWGLYLLLFSRGLSYWLLDIFFSMAALGLWLGRRSAVALLGSLGIFGAIGARHAGHPAGVLAVSLALLALFLWSAGRLQARLDRRYAATPARLTPLRAAAAVAFFLLTAWFILRPLYLMVNPVSRHRTLESVLPAFPVKDPAKLAPPAAALRSHVVALAEKIGERSAYQPDEQDRARDYIISKLKEYGYEPRALEYAALRKSGSGRTRPYYNVEAFLEGTGGMEGAWVVGAHYDTAPGTPGADDNASAVAVLLETARELKKRPPARDTLFVAFSTEEPPAFTTQDMGSFRYAEDLKRRKLEVHCLLNLEMLGYFNHNPKSQLFPPLLDLLHPDTGDFVTLASNLSSLGVQRRAAGSWRRATALPLEPVFLPSVLSALFISDHLNFWFAGERALMLTDTAYFRYPYYHQWADTPDKLDYEKMAEVTRAAAAVLREE